MNEIINEKIDINNHCACRIGSLQPRTSKASSVAQYTEQKEKSTQNQPSC
jgi:hypothetical protein